jgi:hypothetical protein
VLLHWCCYCPKRKILPPEQVCLNMLV